MSHSVFTGRVVQSGEPAFLAEDTDGAIALAEEERDTCPECGWLKIWCRDAENHQFSFDPEESICWPTQRLEVHRNSAAYADRDDATKRATQLVARFREGHEPDLMAGLDLPDED